MEEDLILFSINKLNSYLYRYSAHEFYATLSIIRDHPKRNRPPPAFLHHRRTMHNPFFDECKQKDRHRCVSMRSRTLIERPVQRRRAATPCVASPPLPEQINNPPDVLSTRPHETHETLESRKVEGKNYSKERGLWWKISREPTRRERGSTGTDWTRWICSSNVNSPLDKSLILILRYFEMIPEKFHWFFIKSSISNSLRSNLIIHRWRWNKRSSMFSLAATKSSSLSSWSINTPRCSPSKVLQKYGPALASWLSTHIVQWGARARPVSRVAKPYLSSRFSLNGPTEIPLTRFYQISTFFFGWGGVWNLRGRVLRVARCEAFKVETCVFFLQIVGGEDRRDGGGRGGDQKGGPELLFGRIPREKGWQQRLFQSTHGEWRFRYFFRSFKETESENFNE